MSEQPLKKSFLTEESGKPSYTRISGLWFGIGFVGFAALDIYFSQKGNLSGASRCAEYALWCFIGATAPNLLKGLAAKLIGKVQMPPSDK